MSLLLADFVAEVSDGKADCAWRRVEALVATRSVEAMALKRLR
jgi:hypothetical protein